MKEKLILTRNFLYRLFLIGFILSVVAQLIFMSLTVPMLAEATKILGLPPFFIAKLVSTSLVFTRVFLFYFVLSTALALHWTIARDKHLD